MNPVTRKWKSANGVSFSGMMLFLTTLAHDASSSTSTCSMGVSRDEYSGFTKESSEKNANPASGCQDLQ